MLLLEAMLRDDCESRKMELSEKIELARVRGRYLAWVELVARVDAVRPRDRGWLSGAGLWDSEDALAWCRDPADALPALSDCRGSVSAFSVVCDVFWCSG